MYLSGNDIKNTERVRRLNLINSVSGIKPGNLIGTRSNTGEPNLAIISSVIHLGSDPALLGFIVRPDKEVRRHTLENIQENGYFTINHIHLDFVENAHYTSAKFDKDISEFERCGLTEEKLFDFHAPYVGESKLKIGLRQVDSIPIPVNGTLLIVGEIEHLIVPDEALDERGYINLGVMEGVGISGLNSYYQLTKVNEFPYAYAHKVPEFSEKTTSSY